MKIKAYSDGGSRGNPGDSGSGFVIYGGDGRTIYEQANYWGLGTNNEAEYKGLLTGLRWIEGNMKEEKIDEVEFFLDSELIVKQMKGQYKVKADNLRGLFTGCQELARKIEKIKFKHVKREGNTRADELANMAMDKKENVLLF